MRAELKALGLPSGEAVRWGSRKPVRPRPPSDGDGPARDASPAKRTATAGLCIRPAGPADDTAALLGVDRATLVGFGPVGEDTLDLGRVVVATSDDLARWGGEPGRFRGLVVPAMEPEAVAEALRRFVATIAGASWPEIVERLRETWPEIGERLRPTVRFVARFRARGAATVVTPLDPDATSEYGHLLRDAIYGLAAADGLKVVLDMSEFDYLPSSTLGIFINSQKRLLEGAGDLRLCHLSTKVREVFRVTRTDALFQIDPDEDQAIERLGERAR